MGITGDLQIHLENEAAAFCPGEQVRGRFLWALNARPRAIEVRLFWYTSGHGWEQVQVVARHCVAQPAEKGEGTVALDLPDQPYSFEGKIIQIRWAVELVTIPGKDAQRIELVVSPARQVIVPQPPSMGGAP